MNNCTTIGPVSRSALSLAIILLYIWGSPQPAVAALPALYGQDYFRIGSSWVDGALSNPVEVGQTQGDFDETAYRALLLQLELSDGPYSEALSEPLTSLARYHRGRADYQRALRLYGRALHVVRVNDGLYSKRQVPVIRALLETLREAGDMKELDGRYEYFFRLFGNGEPPYTELRLRASLEFLRWQREAFRTELEGDRNRRLLKMYELNKRILESAASVGKLAPEGYRELVLSQIRNLYLVQGEINPPQERSTFRVNRPILPAQDRGLDPTAQRLETLRRNSETSGRVLLEQLLLRIEGSSRISELAAIYLELGDWQQWNSNYSEAEKNYKKTYDLLGEAGETDLILEWFGEPVELPSNGAYWQESNIGHSKQQLVLNAEYDVTAGGRLRNIQLTGADTQAQAYRSRLRRKLSATRFRPRFALGKAEEVYGVSRSYQLLID